jgi:hypothetical protein
MRPKQYLRKPKAARQKKSNQPFISNGKTLSETQHTFFPPVSSVNNGVQFHTDDKAAALAEQINAKAFTVGSQVFFNKNEYQPSTTEGKKLIAHELVHATQHRHIETVKRKPKETEEEKADGKRASRAHVVFWNDLNKNYPDAGRKLAGSKYDRKTNYLKADFTEGDVKEKIGIVHHSGPSMLIGKNYVDEPDEKTRVSYIPKQMAAIDDWRFKNYRLDDADLDAGLKTKLSSLSLKEIKVFEQKMVERTALTKLSTQAILDWLAEVRFDHFWVDDADLGNTAINKKFAALGPQQLLNWKTEAANFGKSNKTSTSGLLTLIDKLVAAEVQKVISTPIQPDGKLSLDVLGGVEKFSFDVTNATIEVLPDTTGSISTPGETNVEPNFQRPISYSFDAAGVITEFFVPKTNPHQVITMPSKLVLTIRTTYQPGVSPTFTSGYGRGTTEADKAAGNTSIGFHEGSHGTDYIKGAKAIAFPPSMQPGVITRAQFDSLLASLNKLGTDSVKSTDEVGYTQTQYYKDHPDKKPK